MLRAIIFDFDGTIAETERFGHRVAYNAAFADAGLDWDWDEALYGRLLAVGGGKERIAHYVTAYRNNDVTPDALATLVPRLHASKQEHFATLVAGIAFRPGVRRLVAEARARGVAVAIATTAARTGVEALLARDPLLREAFATIVDGDAVPAKKPAPDAYLRALAELQAEAHEAVAIEDAAIGVRAARAAHIATVAALSDYTRDDDVSGAATVVSDLGEPDAPAIYIAGTRPPHNYIDCDFLEYLLKS